MMTQIPIFRAKILDSNEYVEGFYTYDECHKRHLILTNQMLGLSETRIDPTTIAINFPDMLCSQGNRIFASLSEDGKGGDILEVYEGNRLLTTYTVKWALCKTNTTSFDIGKRTAKKIIGIQN